jgi:hypothetical protein
MFARLPGRAPRVGRHELSTEEQATLVSELAPDLRRLETEHGVDIDKYWGLGQVR